MVWRIQKYFKQVLKIAHNLFHGTSCLEKIWNAFIDDLKRSPHVQGLYYGILIFRLTYHWKENWIALTSSHCWTSYLHTFYWKLMLRIWSWIFNCNELYLFIYCRKFFSFQISFSLLIFFFTGLLRFILLVIHKIVYLKWVT